MNILRDKFVMYFLLSLSIDFTLSGRTNVQNSTDLEKKLNRKKRYLIFNNGGTLKYVAGYLGPIDTPSYINCNAIRNFQYQYDVPPNITTIFSKVPARQRSLDGSPIQKPDSTRKIAYDLIEGVMNREGKDGRECMLRAICEIADTPVNQNGLIGELIQLFFTPGNHEIVHQDYFSARQAGLNGGVNCGQLYSSCPMGQGILDSFSLIKEFGFKSMSNLWI